MKTPHHVHLAIFDIDGTIFRSSLLIELFHELVRSGVFPKKAAEEVERNYIAWLNRKGHYNDYLMKLVAVHYKYQKGCSTKKIELAIKKVLDWQKNRVYRFTRNLISNLRRDGYYLMAVSNSQDAMVQEFAKRIGMDAAIGRVLEVVDGHYTGNTIYGGKIFPMDAHLDKVEIVRNFLKENNMTADLKHSIAVGDSEADIPILSAVGHPIAFNPSQPLARLARRRGWRIVVERKDVIYDVRDVKFIAHDEKQKVKLHYGKSASK